MTKEEINKQILGLFNDSNYQELKTYYGKTTVFNVFGIERSETRHSAFLCWLLDVNASHGLGEEPMKKLLRLYASKLDVDDAFRVLLMSGNYELQLTDITTEKATDAIEDGRQNRTKRRDRVDLWATMMLMDSAGKEQRLVMAVENKIYSGEGVNQTERYHQFVTSVCGKGMRPIEIFLAPQKPKALSCHEFVFISYQELLDSVIMPLTHLNMPIEAAQIVSDYIRNLSKPSTAIDGKTYSILAISTAEKEKLMELYNSHKELINMAMVAGNMQKIGDKGKNLIERLEDLDLLEELWHSHEDLFKVVLYVLMEQPEFMMFTPNIYDIVLKDTNRDTTRYNVLLNDKVIGYHLSQAQTALHVFKAYLLNNPQTSMEDLRKAFPRELNNYHYFQNLQYLFYPAAADNPAWDCGKLEGKIGHGDFYTKEEDLLNLKDGKVMCVRWWKKTDGSFQNLVDYVNNNYPYIKIEEY
jgi:hypothetical protein